MSLLITPEVAVTDLYELSGLKSHEETESLNLNDEEVESDDAFDPYRFYSTLDNEEDTSSILSLESRITDLLYLADDIEKAAGMNQTFALEAEKLLPNFGNVSINHYSLTTTATRYKVSLEELSKGVWALIIAAIAALSAMIYKLVKWMFSDSNSDTDGAIGNTINDIKDSESKLDEMEPIIHEFNNEFNNTESNHETVNGIPVYHSKIPSPTDIIAALMKAHANISLDDLISQYCKENDSNIADMLLEKDSLFHDIINKGDYYKIMQAANSKLHLIVFRLVRVIDISTYIIEGAEEAIKHASSTNINQPFNKNAKIFVKLFEDEESSPIAEIVYRIKDTKARIELVETNHEIKFTQIAKVFTDVIKGSEIVPMLEIIQSFKYTLNKLNDVLDSNAKKLETLNVIQDPRMHTYSDAIRRYISSARLELNTTISFIKEVESYGNRIAQIAERICKIHISVFNLIQQGIRENGDNVPDRLKELVSKAKDIVK